MDKLESKMGRILFVLLSIFMISTPFPCLSDEMPPKVILAHADRSRGNIGGIEWIIDLESREGNELHKRKILVKARENNSLAEFIAPPKVKGQKILMLDRNMWFIKPGLRKPVPISPRQKLMGGASNGDIASTDYAGDYKTELVTEEVFRGEPCHVLGLNAASKNTTYSRIRYWVSKKRLVGVKADFLTISGKLLKSAVFEYDHRIPFEDASIPFISRMIITDEVVKKTVTTLVYTQVKLKNIPDAAFNLNLLRR